MFSFLWVSGLAFQSEFLTPRLNEKKITLLAWAQDNPQEFNPTTNTSSPRVLADLDDAHSAVRGAGVVTTAANEGELHDDVQQNRRLIDCSLQDVGALQTSEHNGLVGELQQEAKKGKRIVKQ